jgi:peroxiredoxin
MTASDFPKAPEFSIKALDGKNIRLSDYKGKVVIVDFWATTCPPCRMEIPGFVKLYDKYKSKGLVIIGAAADYPERVKKFVKENKMIYPVGFADGQMAEKFGGIMGIPTTFVIDKTGNIVKKYVGYRPESVFESDFNEYK